MTQSHPNINITLEEITKRFQGGNIETPLDVEDLNALDVRSAIDLIINNKLPLTDEARGELDRTLKFAPEDYRDNFRSTYFTEQEVDTLSASRPISETITPTVEEPKKLSANERLFNVLKDKDSYGGTYEQFQEQFSSV